MAFAHPELLVPSIIALSCALYPAPWHIRNRNVATLGMIFWMSSLNIVHIVNCIVWEKDAEVKVAAWCDISVLITMLYNYGLPLSHLILSRQLESCTSIRLDSPLYDSPSRHRGRMLDLSLALGGPPIGFLVSLSARKTRFNIIEAYGPMPGVYWDTWGVVWVAVVPITIAALCLLYTCKACYNIIRRRQQMMSIISRNAGIDKNHVIRLLVLAIAEMGTCMLRAVFNMTWGTHGLERLRHTSAPRSFTAIRSVSLEDVSRSQRIVFDLSWFTVVACSMVFFLCFATSFETKRFYWGILEAVLPPVKRYRRRKEQEQDKVKLASYVTVNSSRNDAASTIHSHKDVSVSEFSTADAKVDDPEKSAAV